MRHDYGALGGALDSRGFQMKTIVHALVGAAVALCPIAVGAQVSPMVVGGTSAPMLRAGTSVQLRLIQELTTKGKTLKVGHRFDLETSEPVSVNGQVVVPVGSRAVGEVTTVRNKGMWGKSGGITARLVYVQVGDRRLRLSGSMDDKGKTGTGGVVAAIAFIPIAGFFTTGTSAVIAAGTPVTGFLDEDMPIQFAGATTAPMIVPVAQPIVSAPAVAPVAAVTPVALQQK